MRVPERSSEGEGDGTGLGVRPWVTDTLRWRKHQGRGRVCPLRGRTRVPHPSPVPASGKGRSVPTRVPTPMSRTPGTPRLSPRSLHHPKGRDPVSAVKESVAESSRSTKDVDPKVLWVLRDLHWWVQGSGVSSVRSLACPRDGGLRGEGGRGVGSGPTYRVPLYVLPMGPSVTGPVTVCGSTPEVARTRTVGTWGSGTADPHTCLGPSGSVVSGERAGGLRGGWTG